MLGNENAAEATVPAGDAPADKTPVAIRPPQPAKRPKRFMPTTRVSFSKQLELLRGYDAASKQGMQPVSLAEVGAIVKMAPNTISLTSPFFVDVGLLKRTDGGKFIPSPFVREFALAHQWAPDTAARKLGPVMRETWAYEALVSTLRFRNSVPEAEAVTILAQAVEAGPEFRPQLDLILAFLDASGVIQREGGMVRYVLADPGSSVGDAPAVIEPPSDEAPAAPAADVSPATPPAARMPAPAMSSSFSAEPSGVVQFVINVRVEMSEMRNWKADRISAFFGGIAEVLAAKGAVEQDASDVR